jgi:hypothetical protein
MEQTFEQWLKQVDRELNKLIGLSHGDLADKLWRDWYEDEMSPADAAREAAQAEAEEMGFDDLLEEIGDYGF